MKFPQTINQSSTGSVLLNLTAGSTAETASERAGARFEETLQQEVIPSSTRKRRAEQPVAGSRPKDISSAANGRSLPPQEQSLPLEDAMEAGQPVLPEIAVDVEKEGDLEEPDAEVLVLAPVTDIAVQGPQQQAAADILLLPVTAEVSIVGTEAAAAESPEQTPALLSAVLRETGAVQLADDGQILPLQVARQAPSTVAVQLAAEQSEVSDKPVVPAPSLDNKNRPSFPNYPGSQSTASTESWFESLFSAPLTASVQTTRTVSLTPIPTMPDLMALSADSNMLQQNTQLASGNTILATTLYTTEQRQTAAAEARLVHIQQNQMATPPETANGTLTRAGALQLAFGQTGWADNLGRQLLLQSAQGSSSAQIRLDPPELGSLMVKIQLTDQTAAVNFVSPHAIVRDALEQHAPRLQEMFREQGMDLLDVSVSDQRTGQDQRGDQQRAAHAGGDTHSTATAAQQTIQRISNSLIDFYA